MEADRASARPPTCHKLGCTTGDGLANCLDDDTILRNAVHGGDPHALATIWQTVGIVRPRNTHLVGGLRAALANKHLLHTRQVIALVRSCQPKPKHSQPPGIMEGWASGDGMEHAVGQHRPHPRAQCTTGWYPQPPPISALNLVWNCQGWYRRQLAGGFSVPPHVSTEAVVRSKRDRRSSSPRYMPAHHTQATTHTSGHRHKRPHTQVVTTSDHGKHQGGHMARYGAAPTFGCHL